MILLEGKKVAEALMKELPKTKGILAIITVGNDPASAVYVRNKIKACAAVGLTGMHYKFEDDEEALLKVTKLVFQLREDDNVKGIIVQKPYPVLFNGIEDLIPSHKDVDGFGWNNLSATLRGWEPCHYPATPKGIMTLLDYYNIPVEGKNVVVIGRSDIVGKPIAAMMLSRNATVTVCHSKTDNLPLHLACADIIICAVGKPKFLTKEMLGSYQLIHDFKATVTDICKPVIIDVGINRDENGKLCGDVDYENALPYVSAITPVPGGVGPMTVYSLIANCCKKHE